MGENPSISAVFEILKAACLAPTTIPHSKSIKNTFHPILMLGRLAHVCVVKCCHGTAYIREIKYVLLKNSTDVPNEVTSKCINVIC